ncbi:MAG: lipoprotein signal peptidase [Paludibacter sp.]|nr:MAG: lipoprotein signal peptidase [Paludibacter sp.]
MSVRKKSALLIFILLLIDQITKIYVKLNFTIGESVDVLSWFKISFIENEGAAFGLQVVGKLFLTIFRIVAVVVLAIFTHRLIMRKARAGYIYTISLLLAGAAGNILDSVFYGLIFSESTFSQVATLVPFGTGYTSLFHGKVVDMFFFPILKNSNGTTLFFNYIFNVADSCVTVSAFLLFIFYRKDLNESLEKKESQKKDEEIVQA